MTVRRSGGRLEFSPSTGGLASGLGAFYERYRAQWVGWPGVDLRTGRRAAEARLIREFRAHCVLLGESLARDYYSGFSNRTLWPLFHSLVTSVSYAPAEWEAYRRVNELFAEKVAEVAKPRDTIWVHDYHLMLLPALLRTRVPEAKIGFFLHIPFPPYDVFRMMPRHQELIEGLMGADLIGFHTYDYSQAFLRCVRRILGVDNDIGRMTVGRRVVAVDVFPMGVDFDSFAQAGRDPRVQEGVSRMRRRLGGKRLVFSISRLDYTKGIPQQLAAVGALLQAHPEWRGRVVYVCVVVPSRENVDRYAQLKREIDEIVGRINSRFGTMDWTPIQYMYRRLSDPELTALYSLADVALVAPLRDGMNLVAKEFLAARTDNRGVLVLSEMAGAARELLDALIVNPNSRDEIAAALYRALVMPDDEVIARSRAMRRQLRERDIHHWAQRFLDRLRDTIQESRRLLVRLLTSAVAREITARYARARHGLLLLDYDGTLVPFVADPASAVPPVEVTELLGSLARARRTEVVLISGRRKSELQTWFGGLDITLAAEHGAWVRKHGTKRWVATIPSVPPWKDRLRPILQLFVDRVPGSAIEEKDFSIAWHYRRSDLESGLSAAKELVDTLTHLTANMDAMVLAGNKVVEVKSAHASKGLFYASRLAKANWDFILAIGDDATDESLFEVLPPDAYSVRVGLTPSAARFNVETMEGALGLLHDLARAKSAPERRRAAR